MLKEQMERQGVWLFRWRSYLPLIIIPLAIAVFPQSGWMSDRLGLRFEEAWDFFCLSVSLVGLAVRVLTIGSVPSGTSGRTTSEQIANSVNTTGMYSLLRHPLYLGNFLIFAGAMLTLKSPMVMLVAGALYFLYYERIMLAEERFVAQQHGEKYHQWAERTPAILPRFRNWVPSELPFSWRMAVARENHALLLIASLFFVSEIAEGVVIDGDAFSVALESNWFWSSFFLGCAVFYLVVRVIRKNTDFFHVAGR